MSRFASGLFRKFDGFTAGEMRALEAASVRKSFEPGTSLITEGRRAAGCFLLLDGKVDVVTDITGEKQVIATLGPGHIVGQTALVSTGIRRVGVVATEQVEVLALHRTEFERLLAAQTPMAMRFQKQIAIDGIRQLRGAIEKLAHLSERIHKAEESGNEGRKRARRARASRSAIAKAVLTEPSVPVSLLDTVEVSVPEGEMYRKYEKGR